MANFQVISQQEHGSKKWSRYKNYLYASRTSVVEVSHAEINKLISSYPLAIMRTESKYKLVALLGLQNNHNLFVDSAGRWTADYVPAHLRAYPFALLKNNDNQTFVCVDQDSGLISDSGDEPFIQVDGQPSQALQEIIEFLKLDMTTLEQTDAICRSFEEHDLIESWQLTLTFQGVTKPVEGLYKVNERKLSQLDKEIVFQFHQSGYLYIAYAQLLSMQNIQHLQRRLNMETLGQESVDLSGSNKLGFSLNATEESISFDGIN